VKDPSQTVEQLINALIGKIGENIRVRRFSRFKTGEGLEKRQSDLAADVREALGQ
jgi:elongation factor Ts